MLLPFKYITSYYVNEARKGVTCKIIVENYQFSAKCIVSRDIEMNRYSQCCVIACLASLHAGTGRSDI